MEKVILHLGSNVGDRELLLNQGLDLISENIGTILSSSAFYETEPWGVKDQQDFLNLAINVETTLNPLDLLTEAKAIEQIVGRTKKEHWGPRRLDIDIIFYGQKCFIEDHLIIPHKEVQNRNFVLIPVMEIAGDWIHPELNKTVEELYLNSSDTCEVWIFESEKEKL